MTSSLITGLYITNAVLFGALCVFFSFLLGLDIYRANASADAVREKKSLLSTTDRKNKKKNHPSSRSLILLHNIVLTLINCIFSVSIVLDMGSLPRADGQVVNLTRWLVYTVSCGLLSASIADALRHASIWFWTAVALVSGTLFTGFLVSLAASESGRLLLYLAGFVPYIGALFVVVYFRRVRANWAFWLLLAIILITWNIYPVAFVLGHAMYRIISLDAESATYAIGDWFSKMALSLFLVFGSTRWFVQ